ncbi:MAG: alanine racemase [Planctomycetes bacterium]|nr:alanine racemase [Planctomycetota bacterium]
MESYLTAEISASAVTNNLTLLRGRLAPATKLCAAVKADCYGHGRQQILGLIAGKADCLAVATPEEAVAIRRLGYEIPVLMFFSACTYPDGAELRDALDELVSKRIILTVVNQREADRVSESAGRVGRTALVHLKVDTGMTRSGVLPDQAPPLIDNLRKLPGVKLEGIYTHFATADKAFTNRQLEILLDVIGKSGGRAGLTIHAANSAAAIDLPRSQLDMIRPGIAIYGYQPSDEMITRLPLRPALRLIGPLMQVKDVPAGSSTSYGLTYTFDRPSRIGLAPIGYGDGYLRCLSNKSAMRVRGRYAPVRGTICMDQTVIDLTDIPQASAGDEIEIISNDPAAINSVENLARLSGTIPYEITCRLGSRVRRKLVD